MILRTFAGAIRFPSSSYGPSLEVCLFFFNCHTNWVIRLPHEKKCLSKSSAVIYVAALSFAKTSHCSDSFSLWITCYCNIKLGWEQCQPGVPCDGEVLLEMTVCVWLLEAQVLLLHHVSHSCLAVVVFFHRNMQLTVCWFTVQLLSGLWLSGSLISDR